jgi:membrane protein involved in colicin uptake
MHGNSIAGAIASLASRIDGALLAGHDTRELRAELARLEQERRREAAEAAAAEREAREAAEAEERARQEAEVAALVAAAEARVRERIAALQPPDAPNVRRSPAGVYIPDTAAEEIDG